MSPFHVTHHVNAQDFWASNADALLAQESENNLMIGRTLEIISGSRSWPSPCFFTIRQGDTIVGQALHTGEQKPLLCSQMPIEADKALVEACSSAGVMPVQVRGPAPVAKRCALALASRRDGDIRLVQRQGLYALRTVQWPRPDGGTLLRATRAHRPLLLAWMQGFVRECFPNEAEPEALAEDLVRRRLGAGHLFLWVDADGVPVSVAGRTREGPTTANISLVFTPPERRRRGHARSVVAHLSQHWLDSGKAACNLTTNLANPASNKAYADIGYTMLLELRIYDVSGGRTTRPV